MYDIVVIDGNNMANKAFFLNGFMSCETDGKIYRTGVLYGMLSMLLSIVRTGYVGDKSRIFCIWDTPTGSDIRASLDDEYKATRKPTTKEEVQSKREFYEQTEFAKKELFNFRIYQSERVGYEADDIIYTFVKRVRDRYPNRNVLIITEDKDFRQLISDRVHLYSISKKLVWDVSTFQNQMGFNNPSWFADYLALVGDASDNYGGVKGIGDKSAIAILNDPLFTDQMSVLPTPITSILDNTSLIDKLSVTARIKGLLKNGLDALAQNYRLAKFYDVPDVRFKHRNKSVKGNITGMLTKYRMKSLLAEDTFSVLQTLA